MMGSLPFQCQYSSFYILPSTVIFIFLYVVCHAEMLIFNLSLSLSLSVLTAIFQVNLG